jgi:autotransporter-associated beta strand protein
LTGNTTTLTKIGTGNVFFEHSGGSLGTLNATGGIVLLGASDALGNATLNLDGGGVQWAATGTMTNPITIGANGGTLGATTGFTVTLPQNFATPNPVTVIGTGTTVLSGNASITTLGAALSSSGVLSITGAGTIGTLTSTGGTAVLASTTETVGTIAVAGGTTVLAVDPTKVGTFTLGAGTLQVGAGTTSGSLGTYAPTSTPGSTTFLSFNRSDTVTYTNAITSATSGTGSTLLVGSFSIQQNGPGTTILAHSNAYFGGTQVNNGTLMLGASGALGSLTSTQFGTAALGAGGTVNINGADHMAVLDLNGFTQTTQGLRDGGGATANFNNELITNSSANAATLNIVNTGAAAYNGNFTGNLNIVHSGPANETLGGSIGITGGIFLSAGTLTIGTGSTYGLPATTPVTALASGSLSAIAFNRNDPVVTFTQPLSTATGATLSVQLLGTGTTVIGSTSYSFTGGWGLTNGTLQLTSQAALGLTSLSLGTGANPSTSTFDLNGFNQRLTSLSDGGTQSFSSENVINSPGTPVTLSFASGTGTFSGIISGNITILHDGSGFQALEGNNTFTGPVTVSAGTISANVWNAPNTPGPFGQQPDGIGTLTLGGAAQNSTGVLDYAGSASFTLPRPISLAAGSLGGGGGIRVNSTTATITVPAGSISGDGGLQKLGNGTLAIVGAQTYRGAVTMINGNLNIDTVADIGQPSGLGTGDANASAATITFGDGSGNVSTINFNSSTPQSTNRPIGERQNPGNGFSIFAGNLSTPGAVSTSNLTLTGGIDLSNPISSTTFLGGMVVFGGAGTITVASPIVSPNAPAGTGQIILGVSTTGDPNQVGTGTLILSGNNTYGGGTTLRNGTLKIITDSNLGAAGTSVTFAGAGTEAATLLLVGTSTLNRPIVFNQASTATATLVFDSSNITVGPISGSSTFNKTDSGITSTPSVRINGLNIGAGTVSITGARSPSSTSVINTLTIAGSTGAWTSTLDLGSNDLVVDYTATDPFATIQDQIKSGLSGGSWTGKGITSSAAAAAVGGGHPTALGYAEASALLGPSGGTFDGLTVDGTAVLVRYTLSGDANLDGRTNALDFNALASNYGSNNGSQIWSNGDFNYDGFVNTLDFNALATNFNTTPIPGAPVLGTLVPEPASIGLFALCGIGLARRRRKSL